MQGNDTRRLPASYPLPATESQRVSAGELLLYLRAFRRQKVSPAGGLILASLLTHGRLSLHQIYWTTGGDNRRTPTTVESSRINRHLTRLHKKGLICYDRTGPQRKSRYRAWVYPTESAQSMLDPI